MSEFELVIEGPRGKIDVSTLTTMLQEGQKLLRSVSDGNISCTIGNLSMGSAHVSIIAPEPTIDIVLDGLDFLESHNEIPPGWTRKSLEALHGMENCYGRPGSNVSAWGRISDSQRLRKNCWTTRRTRCLRIGFLLGQWKGVFIPIAIGKENLLQSLRSPGRNK